MRSRPSGRLYRRWMTLTHANSGAPSPVRWRITGWEGLGSPFIDYVDEVTTPRGIRAFGPLIHHYGGDARDQG